MKLVLDIGRNVSYTPVNSRERNAKMKFDTIEQLISYAENMEQTESYQVGPGYTNHQRAVYMIGTLQILIDTRLPHNFFKPSEEWYWTGHDFSKEQAELLAEKYNARVEETFYPEDNGADWQIMFDDLNDLLRWAFETKKADLEAEVAN